MATIKHEISGSSNFLRDAEYGTYLLSFIQGFEDEFLLADEVFIIFEDRVLSDPNKKVSNTIDVSEDGKRIELVYQTPRYFMPKEGVSKPEPADFFSGLRIYLENTVIREDNDRFENANREEE